MQQLAPEQRRLLGDRAFDFCMCALDSPPGLSELSVEFRCRTVEALGYAR